MKKKLQSNQNTMSYNADASNDYKNFFAYLQHEKQFVSYMNY